jgi:predicted component of type VI protein secretion system
MLRDCGAILRAAVEGIMMLLLARGEMRKEFEAEERTMVAARDNNPLKLMSDPHEAMDFLFDPAERTDGLPRPGAGGGRRLRGPAHARARADGGMRAAIQGALRRFEPNVIERAFEKSQKGFSLRAARPGCGRCSWWSRTSCRATRRTTSTRSSAATSWALIRPSLRRVKGGR